MFAYFVFVVLFGFYPIHTFAATITCHFTADNFLTKIYLDGTDVTSSVSGTLTNWQTVKSHSFTEQPTAKLEEGVMYSFSMGEEASTASPSASGFLLKCVSSSSSGPWHNLISNVDGRWSGFASTTNTESSSVSMITPTLGNAYPTNWYSNSIAGTAIVSSSSSGFECNDNRCSSSSSGAKKIWVSNTGSPTPYKYAALRVFVTSQPTNSPTIRPTTAAPTICAGCATVTCQFQSNKNIVQVWLDGQSIDVSTLGPSGSNTLKTHTFLEPTLGVTYAFQIDTSDTFCNSCAGLILKCTSSSGTGHWHNLVSSVTPSSQNTPKWSGFVFANQIDFTDQWYSQYVPETDTIISNSAASGCCSGASSIWMNTRGRWGGIRAFVGPVAPTKSPTTASPVSSASPTVPQTCANNWASFQGRCYYMLPLKKDQVKSNTDCNLQLTGSTLGSLNTAAEIVFASNNVGCQNASPAICWVGLYQQGSEAYTAWNWRDGVTAYYYDSSQWQSSPFQPDDLSSTGASGANCGGIQNSKFLDFSCSESYNGLCIKDATCPPGFKKTLSYSVVSSGTIFPGECTPCSPGQYRSSLDSESSCTDCAAGYYGSKAATSSICTSECPAGYYCPPGTGDFSIDSTQKPIPCPAGTYNPITKQSSASACIACPAGYYCLEGSTTGTAFKCQEGYCGNQYSTSPTCSQACVPGYYCPTGSTCPYIGQPDNLPAYKCGGDNFYCPSGRASPLSVPNGYYSVGGTSSTRTNIAICEKGYYCNGGIRYSCPAGKYGPSTERDNLSQCISCAGGYFCSAASTSANDDHCSASNISESLRATYYCPEGTSTRLVIPSPTHITLPTASPTRNRDSTSPCPENMVCANGIASSKVSWNLTISDCDETIHVAEQSSAGFVVASFHAVLADAILQGPIPYSIEYSIASFSYIDVVSHPDCDPGSNPEKNGHNLFVIDSNTGIVTLARNDLNFEACIPVVDMRYNLKVRATASGGSTITNIECTTIIQIDDINDPPHFNETTPIAYRMIKEKQLKNTPADRCNLEASQDFGCPVVESETGNQYIDDLGPALRVFDEDYGTILTFTLSPGPHNSVFKINPCTGIISYSGNYEVSYSSSSPKPAYSFTVIVTDDGNGQQFPTLNATIPLQIFIININDAPILPSLPNPYFQVLENSLMGASLSPSTVSFLDEDGDNVVISLSFNDDGAFSVSSVDGTISLSAFGSSAIDFESSKKIYTLGIIATDGKENGATQGTFRVQIINDNDPPIFDTSRLEFYIIENAVTGTMVCTNPNGICGTLGANPTKQDVDENALLINDEDIQSGIVDDKISFTLITGTQYFSINSSTGIIYAKEGIDFEDSVYDINTGTGRMIQVVVQATSSGEGINHFAPKPLSTQATIKIFIVDVNEAPIIGDGSASIQIDVIESWPEGVGFAINQTKFTITDPDNVDTWIFGSLAPVQLTTFSLASSLTINDAAVDGSKFFSVSTDPTNGFPIFKSLAPLDFKMAPNVPSVCGAGKRCYKIKLIATDNGGPIRESSSTNVIINIIDTNDPPTFPNRIDGYILTISEHPLFEIDGTSTVSDGGNNLVAFDEDSADTLSFEVSGGTGIQLFDIERLSSDGNGLTEFRIFLRAGVNLNFEETQEYSLNIKAFDQGPSSFIGRKCQYNVDKTELIIGCGNSGGAFCSKLDNRCYEFCSSTSFETGEQVSEKPRKNIYFCDYNGNTPVTKYPEQVEQTIIIQILDANDAPYIISNRTATTNPKSDVNCTIKATISSQSYTSSQVVYEEIEVHDDDDIFPSNTFKGAPFTFEKTFPVEEALFWSHFQLDKNTGKIVTVANVPLTQDTILFGKITVLDSNLVPFNSTCTLEVKVVFDNHPPNIASGISKTMPEDSPKNSIILFEFNSDLKLIDIDIPFGDSIVFSSSFAPWYSLNSTTGQLMLVDNSQLNYESLFSSSPQFSRRILVRVTDSYGAEDISTITIQVDDVNEPPHWLTNIMPSEFKVREDLTEGNTVSFSFSNYVSDPDIYSYIHGKPEWNTLTFSMQPCGNTCPFEMGNPTTGTLRIKSGAILDFESSKKSWTLLVTVADGESLSSSRNIVISLEDVNEAPFFISDTPVLNLVENDNALLGANLIDMSSIVSDPDASDPVSSLIFNLTGDVGSIFYVENGILKIQGVLDYESEQSYTLQVVVTDQNGLSSSKKNVTINVLNVNDLIISNITIGGSFDILNCDGSVTNDIYIYGRNFGFKDHTTNSNHQNPTIELSYWFTSSNINDAPTIYLAKDCSVANNDNQFLTCRSVPGVGKNLSFQLKISVPSTSLTFNTASYTFSSSLSYEKPSISSTLNTNALLTVGGQLITIEGRCLSRISDFLDLDHGVNSQIPSGRDSFISYCSSVSCYSPPCVATSSGTRLNCTSIAGLGKDLIWNAKIAGQVTSVGFSSGSYGKPILDLVPSTLARVIPTSGIIPVNSPLIIKGKNFGETNDIPTSAKLIYRFTPPGTNSQVIEERNLKGCKVTSALGLRNEIQCTGSDEGVGHSLSVVVEFGGLKNDEGEMMVNYTSPIVTDLVGDEKDEANTLGGQIVTLKGENFGPECGVPASDSGFGGSEGLACNHITVSYSKGSKRASNPSQTIVYYPKCAVLTQDRMSCEIAPGTGQNHTWQVWVGEQEALYASNLPKTSYAPPTVGSYSGDGSRNANTTGYQEIVVKGSNFGPLDGASIVAYYGNEDYPDEFYTEDCHVSVSHQDIICLTVEGVGNSLAWVLYVDGQKSRSELTNYAAPTITDIMIDGGKLSLSPDGGDLVYIQGQNFGPKILDSPAQAVFLEAVSFGTSKESNIYPGSLCIVISHTLIQCYTPSGIGSNLSWQVKVKGQVSPKSTVTTSYDDLSISSLSPLSGNSRGGYMGRIIGTGLALCDPNTVIKINFGSVDVSPSGYFNESAKPIDSCPTTKIRMVDFIVPERTGSSLISVSVSMKSSLHSSEVPMVTSPFTFYYNPPVISNVYAEPGGALGAVSVTIIGLNFCASESCCSTYYQDSKWNGVVSHSHERIKLFVPRAGKVQIICADGQNSTIKEFEASSPFLTGTIPQLDGVDFETRGGEEIEVWGLYLGLSPRYFIGDFEAAVISHEEVLCDDSNRPQSARDLSLDSSVICYKSVIRTPPGGGRNLPLVVLTLDQTSLADDTRFEFFNYKIPRITNVMGAGISHRFDTVGTIKSSSSLNNAITIQGENFYINGTIRAGSLSLGITCDPYSWDHETIICFASPGEGVGHQWVVTVEGSSSVPFGTTTTSLYYKPPSGVLITNLPPVPYGYSTEGNDFISLSGENFGRKLSQSVFINGKSCIIVDSSHSYINCYTPEGEGKSLLISVTVASQSAISSDLFSYGAPVITQVSPATGSTRAIKDGNPIILTISGYNFGVDIVSLYMNGIFLLGERDSSKDSDLIKKRFISATHRELKVYLPEYFGYNIPLSVSVKDQSFVGGIDKPISVFSYLEPQVQNISYTTGGGIIVSGQTGIGTSPPSSAGFGLSSSGRRVLNDGRLLDGSGSYGSWSSNGFGTCKGDYRIQGIFWRDSIEIDLQGLYTKTTQHFSTSNCEGSSKLFTVILTGSLVDLGINPTMTCGQSFENIVSSIQVVPHSLEGTTALNARCNCTNEKPTFAESVLTNVGNCMKSSIIKLENGTIVSNECKILTIPHHAGSKFGLYVIVDDHELYMSTLFDTLNDVLSSEAFGLSDIPTAYSSQTPQLTGPSFPTDGCYLWEDNSEYNRRRREAFVNIGNTEIPRICLDKALLILNGDNFGLNFLNQPGVLRVTFVNPLTGEEFEASTTSSEGNHRQLCTVASGCSHTHTSVKVWVPYGSGRALRVRLQVGNQISFANFTVNYLPPHIDAVFPGTIFRKAAFQDADGQRIVIQGLNFGWIGSSANILINGRKCSKESWFAGSDGEPYIECFAARDTVGPKSIMACVANQTYVSRIFKTDGAFLAAGEAAGVWRDGTDVVQSDSSGYAARIYSSIVTRCTAKKYGRLYELCSDCPVGADCGIGSFKSPQAEFGFFGYEINRINDPERAQIRCGAGTYQNETSLAKFPDSIIRETCLDFVKCEPEESCAGGNKCNEGYQYAELSCKKVRDSISDGNPFVSSVGDVISTNECRVKLNPYTGEYEGIQSDCRGNLTIGQACDWRRPWECSVCSLVYPKAEVEANQSSITDIPKGVCTCIPSNRCSLCTINTHYRLNNACTKCPENVALLISLFIIGAIIACALAYYLSKKKVNLAFVAIAVDYCQVLSIFSNTRIVWPPAIKRFLELLTLFNLNIDIAAPECILPSFEYEVKFYATEFLPLAALGVLGFIHLSYTSYKIFRDGKRVKFSSHTSKLISVFLIIMYFLYLTVTKRALDIFNCNPTIPSDGYSYTEFTSIKCGGGGLCRCYEPGGVQMSLVPAAYIFILLYGAGFPLFILLIIYTNRVLVMEDQYLRAYGIGDTRETNPDAYDFRKKYHLLYMYYKPRMSFWMLAILFRKFMIAMSSLMFRGNPTFQMTIILLVLFWSFVIQARYRPFLSTGERGAVIKELETRAAQAINDPIHFQIDYELLKKVTTAVRVGGEMERRMKDGKNKKQVGKLWENDDINRKRAKRNRIAHSAHAYFFDFNTVELILLGCSIFICLCGIMFQSGRYEGRRDLDDERDSITYLMLLIVFFSFLYMALVAASEAAPWIYTLYLSRFMKRNDAIIEKELDQGVIISENPLLNAKVIGAANAEELTQALESNINALNKTKLQNQELLTDLQKIKSHQ